LKKSKTQKTLRSTLIKTVQLLPIIAYILLEEFVWESIAEPIYRYIHSLQLTQKMEAVVDEANRYTILLMFLFIFIAVESVGLYAGVLMLAGMPVRALSLYALKVPIATVAFWLFRSAKEKLLSFVWFAFLYETVTKISKWIKSLEMYRDAIEILNRIKRWMENIYTKSGARGYIKRWIARVYRLLKKRL